MLVRKLVIAILFIAISGGAVEAQRKAGSARPAAAKAREVGSTAVVMDETLSVLRVKPSLFAESVQRMRRGRTVRILGVVEADGVKFFRVAAPQIGRASCRDRG